MRKKTTKLTKAQNDVCYEIKFALIRGILNMKQDMLWELVQKAIKEKENDNKDQDNL